MGGRAQAPCPSEGSSHGAVALALQGHLDALGAGPAEPGAPSEPPVRGLPPGPRGRAQGTSLHSVWAPKGHSGVYFILCSADSNIALCKLPLFAVFKANFTRVTEATAMG